MTKRNKLILEKIEKLTPDIRELATRALEYAESDPQPLVTDKLKSVVRRIIKSKEESS